VQGQLRAAIAGERIAGVLGPRGCEPGEGGACSPARPRHASEVSGAKADGRYGNLLSALARADLLVRRQLRTGTGAGSGTAAASALHLIIRSMAPCPGGARSQRFLQRRMPGALLAVACLVVGARPAAAACRLYPGDQQRLAQLQGSSLIDPQTARYNQGLIFLHNRCFAESIAAFQETETALARQGHLVTFQSDLLVLARGGRNLAEALQKVERGDREPGLAQLLRTVHEVVASVVQRDALLALASLLPPAAAEWSEIEVDLALLAGRGDWQAQRALTQRRVAIGQGGSAIADLERRVAAPNRRTGRGPPGVRQQRSLRNQRAVSVHGVLADLR